MKKKQETKIKKLNSSAVPSVAFKPRRIKIKVFGIGGGGAAIVSEMSQHLSGVSFVAADTDVRVFKKVRRKVKVFQFGEEMLGGKGTGMDADLASKAAMAEKQRIDEIFIGQDIVVFVGSLGGGVCSGAGPIFAESARNQKVITLGLFTLPFQFEGDKKMRLAKKSLIAFRENLSGVAVAPNEKIFEIIDKKTPLKKALSILNCVFASWLDDLIEVIAKPSLINIDFADLRTILKERGKVLFLGQGLSGGVNRAEEALKNIFQNPIFGKAPGKIKKILFNIAGGKDLTLKEVELISQSIANLNMKAKIIFGVSELPKYAGKIKITLLALSDDWESQDDVKKANDDFLVFGESIQGGKNVEKEKQKIKNKKAKKEAQEAIEIKKKKAKNLIKKKPQIRRTALEGKQQQDEAETAEWANGIEWEVPPFLRGK